MFQSLLLYQHLSRYQGTQPAVVSMENGRHSYQISSFFSTVWYKARNLLIQTPLVRHLISCITYTILTAFDQFCSFTSQTDHCREKQKRVYGKEKKPSMTVNSHNFSSQVLLEVLFKKMLLVRHKFLAEAKLSFFEQLLWKAMHYGNF